MLENTFLVFRVDFDEFGPPKEVKTSKKSPKRPKPSGDGIVGHGYIYGKKNFGLGPLLLLNMGGNLNHFFLKSPKSCDHAKSSELHQEHSPRT